MLCADKENKHSEADNVLGDNLLVPTFWHAGGDILNYQGTSQLAELTEGVTAISIITLALKQKIKEDFSSFQFASQVGIKKVHAFIQEQ